MSLILEAGGRAMSRAIRVGWMAVCGIAALLATDAVCFAQGPTDNPYRPVRGLADGGGPSVPGGEWARLRAGARWDRRLRCMSTWTEKASGPLSDVMRRARCRSQGERPLRDRLHESRRHA